MLVRLSTPIMGLAVEEMNMGFKILFVFLFLICVTPGFTKNPGYNTMFSLDPSDDDFWLNNNIFVTRLQFTMQSPSQRTVNMSGIRVISGQPPTLTQNLPANAFLSLDLRQTQVLLQTNDSGNYVVVMPMVQSGGPAKGPRGHPLYFVEKAEGTDASPLVKALDDIAALRTNGSRLQDLLNLLSSGNDLSTEYALKHLAVRLNDPGLDKQSVFSLLLTIRDNVKLSLAVRILASQLYREAGGSISQFPWVQAHLEDVSSLRTLNYSQLTLLIRYGSSFSEGRGIVVTYLIAVIDSPHADVDLKSIASAGLRSPALFNYSNPTDPLSQEIFHTYTGLLGNANPLLRIDAALSLKSLCNAVTGTEARKTLTKRAMNAISAQSRRESDPIVLVQLKPTIEDMENFSNWPPPSSKTSLP